MLQSDCVGQQQTYCLLQPAKYCDSSINTTMTIDDRSARRTDKPTGLRPLSLVDVGTNISAANVKVPRR